MQAVSSSQELLASCACKHIFHLTYHNKATVGIRNRSLSENGDRIHIAEIIQLSTSVSFISPPWCHNPLWLMLTSMGQVLPPSHAQKFADSPATNQPHASISRTHSYLDRSPPFPRLVSTRHFLAPFLTRLLSRLHRW